ncbi:DUF2334 domain-containing protein [Rhodococcus sp. BP-252]|uniref:Deacetylase n=1 Tax=Rhodococcoides kyotonense TaxID=398843 RepID=A0A177YGC0_9NOCA|nr:MULTISPECIES: DUF2334 domain-containing protein [Rhodococcus]MBY6412762.1 DUF2334 domain-containing protein [Rhodococcus sp. BP-320]MBY6417440.1 DUF2334 domain-containing protein [Rhodococcus sp. BP-321]MBY6421782.1 DUF2334 domain-containing protein [Rhodococcus sp. BP-324]MBY6427521.1 DUF2334 domain-containing protein [Rhodococcus sp. BP-323]MBY6432628.1 DUF2334 domain-containing protein [Rhodococcus sp. BP-322]
MSGRLIVSVSGIRDDTCENVVEFAQELDKRGVAMSLLVAPRLKDKYRLTQDELTQDWLRSRRDRGDAIVLHGYDQAATKRRRAEFAALPRHEARLRLMAADRVMEEIGLRTRVFAPPRWVASPGAVAALPDAGFRMIAGVSAIHDLETGAVQRGRVLGIGEGFKTEPWWCRALVIGAGRTARRDGLIRLSVSAKQLGRSGPHQAMLDAVDLALYSGAEPAVYEHVRRIRRAA